MMKLFLFECLIQAHKYMLNGANCIHTHKSMYPKRRQILAQTRKSYDLLQR